MKTISDGASGRAVAFNVGPSSSESSHARYSLEVAVGQRVRLRFAVRVSDPVKPGGFFHLAALSFPGTSLEANIAADQNGATVLLRDLSHNYDTVGSMSFLSGAWVSVELTIDLVTKTLSFAIDDVARTMTTFDIDRTPTKLRLLFGPSFTSLNEPFQVSFDSLRLKLD